MDAETLQKCLEIAEWVRINIGTWPLYVAFALWVAWVVWGEYRRWSEESKVIAEKERTIQRLAADNRLLRIQHLKSQGWTDEDIDRYLIANDYSTGAEARRSLEKEPVKPQLTTKKPRNKR